MASSADMPLTCSRATIRSWLSFSSSSRPLSSSICFSRSLRSRCSSMSERWSSCSSRACEPALEVGELGAPLAGVVLGLALEADLLFLGLEDQVLLLGAGVGDDPAAFSVAALIDWFAQLAAGDEAQRRRQRQGRPAPQGRGRRSPSSSSHPTGLGGRTRRRSDVVRRRDRRGRRRSQRRSLLRRPGGSALGGPCSGSSSTTAVASACALMAATARLGVEAVPREQRVGPLAPRPRVRHASERRARAAPARAAARLRVGLRVAPTSRSSITSSTVVAGRCPSPQLDPQRALAARPRPVARLDPGPRERLVVEDPELGQPRDRALDELRPVAGPLRRRRTSPTDRWRASRNRSARLEHQRRIRDLGALRPPNRDRLRVPPPDVHAADCSSSPSGGPIARRAASTDRERTRRA